MFLKPHFRIASINKLASFFIPYWIFNFYVYKNKGFHVYKTIHHISTLVWWRYSVTKTIEYKEYGSVGNKFPFYFDSTLHYLHILYSIKEFNDHNSGNIKIVFKNLSLFILFLNNSDFLGVLSKNIFYYTLPFFFIKNLTFYKKCWNLLATGNLWIPCQ